MCLLALLTLALVSAHAQSWPLVNFAQRLEIEVSNPSRHAVETLAVIPVEAASRVAPGFPGSLAIAMLDGVAIPSQAESDEFVVPVKLAAGETRTLHIYYSTTLHDSIVWTKRVHASHAF